MSDTQTARPTVDDPFGHQDTADLVPRQPPPAALVEAPNESMQTMISMMRLASQYPRDLRAVSIEISQMAQRLGEKATYRWEVKNRQRGTTDIVEGPTVKCAMMVAQAMGNCVVNARVVREDGDSWLFAGRVVDFEKRIIVEREFSQRKRQGMGMKDDARALDIVFQIGQSKAIRNAIVAAWGVWIEYATDEAKRSALQWVEADPPRAKAAVRSRAEELGIGLNLIETKRGRSIENMTVRDLALTIAEIRSITEGQATADDIYSDLVMAEAKVKTVEADAVKAEAQAKLDGRSKAAKEAKAKAEAEAAAAREAEAKPTPEPDPAPEPTAQPEPAPVETKPEPAPAAPAKKAVNLFDAEGE